MTSPIDLSELGVGDSWVDSEGEVNILVTLTEDPFAHIYLSPEGVWDVYYVDCSRPDAETQRVIIHAATRHIIERVFGGKTT